MQIRQWLLPAVAAGALLLGTVATAHSGETIELGKVGWTHLHKAAAEGSVEKIDALLFGGHAVDERITAAQEIARLEAIAEEQSQATIAEIMRWSDSLNRSVKDSHESKTPMRREKTVPTPKDLAQSILRSIESGVDLWMLQLMEGATALHVAGGAGHYAAAKRLIEKGADVNAQTKAGMHPIHFSAVANEVQLLGLMLEHGADSEESSTKTGLRPLHWAAFGNAVQTARELLRRGVSVNATTNDGATSMDIANAHGHKAYLLQKLLREHGGRCAKNCLCESEHEEGLACQP